MDPRQFPAGGVRRAHPGLAHQLAQQLAQRLAHQLAQPPEGP
ncbi:MAG: hypothetical protein ACOYY2_06850 [Actinomycetota bacterium]